MNTSHRKIKQWPRDPQVFAKLVRNAINAGTHPNTTFTELEPIEPGVYKSYLPPHRRQKRQGPWAHAETFLHRAIRNKLYDLAEFLLQSGADVDKRNELGRAPLHEAVLDGDWQAVGFLTKHGADVESLTLSSDVVWFKGGEAVPGEGGLTAMHLALYNSNVDMLRLLVAQGASVNHKAQDVWSYLDLALLFEDRRATEFFLSQGLELRKETFGFKDPKQSKTLAQKLQAWITSRRMIPPRELWDSYKEALSRLHFCKWGVDIVDEEDSPAADLVVETFSEHLETLAGVGSNYRQFCDNCSQLKDELCFFYEENAMHDSFQYQLKPSRQALLETADRKEWPCALCAYIADSLDFFEASVREVKQLPDEWEPLGGPVEISVLMTDVPWEINDTVRAFTGSCGTLGLYADAENYTDNFGFRHDFDWINSLSLPSSHEPDDRYLGTGSQRAYSMAEKWLSNCTNNHVCPKVCQRRTPTTYRPRLLHIGDESHPLRLVEDPGDEIHYVALSSCSDKSRSDHSTTTTANIEQKKVRIDINGLPATFQEAIHATRRLGFNYIWIDALCVVQDSPEAWSERVSKRHSVYDGAALTISKVQTSSESDPLFTPRRSRSLHPVPLSIWQPKCRRPAYSEGVIHSFALVRTEYAKNPEIEGHNSRRAWSLQEELFSSRILQFGDGMLHWECLCNYENEALSPRHDYARNIIGRRIRPRAVFRGVCTQHASGNGAQTLTPMQNWQFLLETYSQRELAEASDRLPAFWAISKYTESILHDEFSCGLWKRQLFLESLCWAAVTPSLDKPSLPSWTWVSNQQELTFDCLDRSGRQVEVIRLAELRSFDGVMCPETYVVSGTLTLQGPLYPLESRSKDWAWDTKYLDFEREQRTCEQEDEDIYPSVLDGVDVTGCYVLEILGFRGTTAQRQEDKFTNWPGGRPAAKVALLLEKIEEQKMVFRRAGILTMEFVRGDLNPERFGYETLHQTVTLI